MRWRVSSRQPNGPMRPRRMRARSRFSASRRACSTCCMCEDSRRSMKSITMTPPRSRMRSWRATSGTASRSVLSAVVSRSSSSVRRPEFTSIATSASVGSMTIEPPEGRRMVRRNASSMAASTPNAWSSGVGPGWTSTDGRRPPGGRLARRLPIARRPARLPRRPTTAAGLVEGGGRTAARPRRRGGRPVRRRGVGADLVGRAGALRRIGGPCRVGRPARAPPSVRRRPPRRLRSSRDAWDGSSAGTRGSAPPSTRRP